MNACRSWFAVLLVSTIASVGLAGEPSADSQTVAGLIEQLDSDEFAVRQKATERLIEIGLPAVAAVAKAADSDRLEVSQRCLEAMRRWLAADDEKLKAGAKTALERLAESDSPSAERARELLGKDQPAPREPQAQQANPFNIQFGAIRMGIRRVRVQNNNGQKTIDAEENGKKVHIEESPEGKITMTVAETVDGKEKTSKYEAKNAEELKKQHPQAHGLYQKYAQGNRVAAQVRAAQARAAQVRAAKARAAARRGIARPATAETIEQLDETRKELEKAAETLRKLAKSKASAEDLETLAEEIEDARKRVEKAHEQLKR